MLQGMKQQKLVHVAPNIYAIPGQQPDIGADPVSHESRLKSLYPDRNMASRDAPGVQSPRAARDAS